MPLSRWARRENGLFVPSLRSARPANASLLTWHTSGSSRPEVWSTTGSGLSFFTVPACRVLTSGNETEKKEKKKHWCFSASSVANPPVLKVGRRPHPNPHPHLHQHNKHIYIFDDATSHKRRRRSTFLGSNCVKTAGRKRQRRAGGWPRPSPRKQVAD